MRLDDFVCKLVHQALNIELSLKHLFSANLPYPCIHPIQLPVPFYSCPQSDTSHLFRRLNNNSIPSRLTLTRWTDRLLFRTRRVPPPQEENHSRSNKCQSYKPTNHATNYGTFIGLLSSSTTWGRCWRSSTRAFGGRGFCVNRRRG
jgi:hypothetical protein